MLIVFFVRFLDADVDDDSGAEGGGQSCGTSIGNTRSRAARAVLNSILVKYPTF